MGQPATAQGVHAWHQAGPCCAANSLTECLHLVADTRYTEKQAPAPVMGVGFLLGDGMFWKDSGDGGMTL